MTRRMAVIGAVLLGGGAACLNTAEPRGFTFRYQIFASGCDTTCAAPGSVPIDSAARGDTIWLQHVVELIGAVDSVTPQPATLRPDCAENVAVLAGNSTVRSVPTPATCPDSTFEQNFTLQGITFPSIVVRYNRWVVDPALSPAVYGLRGRVMVQPRIEPIFAFTIR